MIVDEKTLENQAIDTIVEEKNKTQNHAENTTIFKPYEPKEKSNNLPIIGIFVLIFITLCLVAYMIFTLVNLKNTKIISGISIKGIDISHLTKEEALEKVENQIANLIPEELKLKHNDYETSISTNKLEIHFDIASAIQLAYETGRTDNILKNNGIILQTKLFKKNIEPLLTLNEEHLLQDLEDISSKLPDTIIESSYFIEDTNLILTKGKTGNIVDATNTLIKVKEEIKALTIQKQMIPLVTEEKNPTPLNMDAIHQELYKEAKDAYHTQEPFAVYASENGVDFAISMDEAKAMLNEEKEEYAIPLKVLFPNVTTNMLGNEAFPDLLASYSTKYVISNKNRTTNLILAANKINGTVLMPGETFSYNKVVGKRTITAGYKEAPIYVSGKVVDGLGGGICQISSTLYNAVVYANLDIVERTNHQFVPSYVTASRDATVVYGSLDFKFKNNRDYPIKLTCSVQNGVAAFQIFGLKSGNDYQVEIVSKITNQTKTSIYSEAYKVLRQNGNLISSTLLSRDTYKKH